MYDMMFMMVNSNKLKRFDNEMVARAMLKVDGFKRQSAYYVVGGGNSIKDVKLWNQFLLDKKEFISIHPNYIEYV